MRFKVLHTEHNASHFQGGESWDGLKEGDVWDRGGLINGDHTKGGAGYNLSVKFAKKCPAITFEHDAWTFGGCLPHELYHCNFSNQFPILHLHDFFRDSYVAIRRNAADNLWLDREKFGFYKVDADRIEATQSEWFSDPKWTQTTSPFEELMPWYIRDLLGRTSYKVRYDLLREWKHG